MKNVVCLLALGLLITAGGCSMGAPYGTSFDRHNFVSTDTRPLTLVVRDTIAGEEVLRIDIPVRRKLVIDFEHKHDYTMTATSSLPAESMSWQIMGPKDWEPMVGKLKHRKQLTGNNIIMKLIVRDSPDQVTTTEPMAGAGPAKAAAASDMPKPMQIQTDQSAGVGIKFEKRPNELHIVDVFDNTPAAQAGLAEGDAVVAIDGAPVSKMSMQQVLAALSGPDATRVVLSVKLRSGLVSDIPVLRGPVALDVDEPAPMKSNAKPME